MILQAPDGMYLLTVRKSVIETSNPLHGRYAPFEARNVLEFSVKAERR